ncbi:MAG: hypothetical protein ACTTKH_06210 [Treponema sp.]
MGTWAYSFGFTTTQALAEYGKQIVEGTMSKGSKADVIRAYSIFTPCANWNGSNYVERSSGNEKSNHMLVYQDTYVFGKGYLGMIDVEVPNVYPLLNEFNASK